MRKPGTRLKAGMIVCLTVLLLASCGGRSGSAENEQGLALYESGDYEGARDAFDEAIGEDSRRGIYYANKALAQAGLSDFEGAGETVRQGLELEPENAEIYRAAGIVSFQAGNYEEACGYFESALGILGNEKGQTEMRTDIRRYKADAEYRTGDYAAAAEEYTQLIQTDENNAEYYFLRGKAYAAAGDLDSARPDFSKVNELRPEKPEYYVTMYKLLSEGGYEEEGRTYLETAVAIAPSGTEDQKSVGAAYYFLGNYEEASNAFQAMPETERDENAWIFLGLSLEGLGDNEGASQAFEQALAMTDSQASVYYQMAVCQMKAGNYYQALADAQAGLALNDGNVNGRLAYAEAVCYEYLGDFQTALQKFTAYRDTYGSSEAVEHEISFLQTRVQ